MLKLKHFEKTFKIGKKKSTGAASTEHILSLKSENLMIHS